jgi:hypothetical protein
VLAERKAIESFQQAEKTVIDVAKNPGAIDALIGQRTVSKKQSALDKLPQLTELLKSGKNAKAMCNEMQAKFNFNFRQHAEPEPHGPPHMPCFEHSTRMVMPPEYAGYLRCSCEFDSGKQSAAKKKEAAAAASQSIVNQLKVALSL